MEVDDDGGQEGDLMGLNGGKGKQGKGQCTMDTATRMDSGDTRQRIASQRRQCVATVDHCLENRKRSAMEGRKEGRKQGEKKR